MMEWEKIDEDNVGDDDDDDNEEWCDAAIKPNSVWLCVCVCSDVISMLFLSSPFIHLFHCTRKMMVTCDA